MKRTPIEALVPTVPDEQLLTTADLAAIFCCERSKIQRILTDGTLTGAVQLGSRLLISAGNVRKWIAANELPRNAEIHDLRRRLRAS